MENIELIHFSQRKFKFNPKRSYPDVPPLSIKPHGLWLSHEDEYGWSEWCRNENFSIASLKHRAKFHVNPNDLLWLRTSMDCEVFSKKYKDDLDPLASVLLIPISYVDWNRVKKDYPGILISPYRHMNLRMRYMWYNTWDCASACVWDLSVLKLAS